MKISFSIQSKPNSKSNPIKPSINFDPTDSNYGNVKTREYIKEFDSSKSPYDPNKKSTIVIPPIENELNIGRSLKRMKNLDLPITESNVKVGFELDTSNVVEPGSDMSYGLNVRHIKNDDVDKEKNAASSVAGDNNTRLHKHVSIESVIQQKFKDDMKMLPDDKGFDKFEDVTVEDFGAALLAGYGWHEGMGIGKNAREDVKVLHYERKNDKRGLGFVSDCAHNKRIQIS